MSDKKSPPKMPQAERAGPVLCSGERVTPDGGAVVLEPLPSRRAWKGHGFLLFLNSAARWVLSRQVSHHAPSIHWGCDEDMTWTCDAESDGLLLPVGDQAWSASGAGRADVSGSRATIRIATGLFAARRAADAHAQRTLPSVLARYAAVCKARVPGSAPVAPAELQSTLALLRSVIEDTAALVPAGSELQAARKCGKEAGSQLRQLQAELGAMSCEGAAAALAKSHQSTQKVTKTRNGKRKVFVQRVDECATLCEKEDVASRLQQLGELSGTFAEQEGGGRKRKRGADNGDEDADVAQKEEAADGEGDGDGDIATHATACAQGALQIFDDWLQRYTPAVVASNVDAAIRTLREATLRGFDTPSSVAAREAVRRRWGMRAGC